MTNQLRDHIDWQSHVNRIVMDAGQPIDNGILTREEMDAAYTAYALGTSAEEFAAMVLDGRAAVTVSLPSDERDVMGDETMAPEMAR